MQSMDICIWAYRIEVIQWIRLPLKKKKYLKTHQAPPALKDESNLFSIKNNLSKHEELIPKKYHI